MQPQHRDLYLWSPCLHTRTTSHKTRRGNHLRLWERLSQVRDRTFALPVQTMPKAARPQAERGARRTETPSDTAGPDATQKALIPAQSRRRMASDPRSPAIRFSLCLSICGHARHSRKLAGAFPLTADSLERAVTRADRIPLGILF